MKIQSKSDIITNSSSEVFIILREDAERVEQAYPEGSGCMSSETINEHFLERNPWEVKSIYEALGKHAPYSGYDYDQVRQMIDDILPEFKEAFSNGDYVFLDIEDHFEDFDSAYSMAEELSIWYDYRH